MHNPSYTLLTSSWELLHLFSWSSLSISLFPMSLSGLGIQAVLACRTSKPWGAPQLVPGNFVENAIVSSGAPSEPEPGAVFQKVYLWLSFTHRWRYFHCKALAQVFSLCCSCSCSAILLNLQAQTCYKIVVPLVSVVVPYSFLLSRLCIFLFFVLGSWG